MSKPSYGILVGRFQVHDLHEGHMELFRAVRGRHNRVIVFVGVAPTGMTKRNPLDFITRKAMIQAKFPDITVLPLMDCMTDVQWSILLDSKIREVVDYGDVTLYGGRDSFMPHYRGSYDPVELTLPGTEGIKGEDIRERLTNTVVETADFRAGVIYAAMNQRPRVIPCVDIVLYHYSGSEPDGFQLEFLLGKKTGEPGWRWIGGHAETHNSSYEKDAKDETMQESGHDIQHAEYIGSCLVPDWRWKNEESKVKTLVFAAETMTLSGTAADDIAEVKWFRANLLTEKLIVPVHHPILELVKKRFKEEFSATTV